MYLILFLQIFSLLSVNGMSDPLAVNSRKRPRLEDGEIDEQESQTRSVLISSSSPPTIQLNSPLEPVDSTHIDFGDYIAEYYSFYISIIFSLLITSFYI